MATEAGSPLLLVGASVHLLVTKTVFPCKASCSFVAPAYARGPGCLRPMGPLLVSVPLVSTAHRLLLLLLSNCSAAAAADFHRPVSRSHVSRPDHCADQSKAENIVNQQKYSLKHFLGYNTRTLAP